MRPIKFVFAWSMGLEKMYLDTVIINMYIALGLGPTNPWVQNFQNICPFPARFALLMTF